MQYPQMLRLAGRQYGLLTSRQALAHLTEGHWRRLKKLKVARPYRYGVWELGAVTPSWQQAVMAAVLARPGAVASHLTAAKLWGLDVAVDRLSIVAPPDTNQRLPGVIVHRRATIRSTVLGGIPVTTVSQTLFDSAGVARIDIEALLDQALRDKLVTLKHLRALFVIEGTKGHKGAHILRRLVSERSAIHERAEAKEEINVASWLETAGLPTPVSNFRVPTLRSHRRIDLAYPDAKVGIEVDDWWSHHTYTDLTNGTDRDLELELAGWHIIHVRKRTDRNLLLAALRARLP